jgi:hypothetical protein
MNVKNTCGATACIEQDPEDPKDFIIKSQPEQPSKYNDLDFKDFDIVKAAQVRQLFNFRFISNHPSLSHSTALMNEFESLLRQGMMLIHPTMIPFISSIGPQSIIVERLSSISSKRMRISTQREEICNQLHSTGVFVKVTWQQPSSSCKQTQIPPLETLKVVRQFI